MQKNAAVDKEFARFADRPGLVKTDQRFDSRGQPCFSVLALLLVIQIVVVATFGGSLPEDRAQVFDDRANVNV